MLVISSSVRMVHRVHCHTTSLGPAVALRLELVERSASLEQRLIDTRATSNDTNSRPRVSEDGLLRPTGQPDPGLVLVGGVTDDGRVVSGCPGERTTVTGLLLDVADDGTFGHFADWEDVADRQLGLLAAVDERASVETLGGDESLGYAAVFVRVLELDEGERCTTARVVDDVPHYAPKIAISLCVVERA